MFGRVIVLQTANLFYLLFNLGCGLAQTKTQLIIFRFLSGLGGSAPLAIGGGVLSDLFTAEQRGRAIAIYSLAPLLGPAVGPVAGGFVRLILLKSYSFAKSRETGSCFGSHHQWRALGFLSSPMNALPQYNANLLIDRRKNDLALGFLRNDNSRRAHSNFRLIFPTRDLPSRPATSQEKKSHQGNWK